MSLSSIKLDGDTGWSSTPTLAHLEVLDSDTTIMHAVSTPGNTRTITGWLVDSAESAYNAIVAIANARTITSYDGVECYILSVVGQRVQNIGDAQVWRVTVGLKQASA